MSDIGEMMARAMMAYLVMTIAITAALTAALILGVPWLWHVLKPLLHRWTA